ncbi:DNA-processing protein DprA [Pirellulaceae bacterium]|jgi:DNA processing protein|nr:DNA-processing protein DprA [Pirellulaceae bacterium]MDB4794425.1 DNA-processing protein DprA [Pirellulaceae bacterium]
MTLRSDTTAEAKEIDEENLIRSIQLNMISGLGPRLRQQLLLHFETPNAILAASPYDLQKVPGIGHQLAMSITHSDYQQQSVDEIRKSRQHSIDLILDQHDQYPGSLKNIPDPPGVLYCKGKLLKSDALAIAVVGTRHASRYGIDQTQRLVTSLVQCGFTIVSGLARGIDTAAHAAALEAGGRTIAVLGSGLLHLYPPENKNLANAISKSGAVLTEARLASKPTPFCFPQRNRIITGLSLGVVVIEAAMRSGAMISARHAMEQNRDVFALPGRIDCRTSSGCHHLIRDGAKLVENVDHIIEELGPLEAKTIDTKGHQVHHPAELKLNDQERKVLDSISGSTTIDEIVQTSNLPAGRVLATISVLEMKRLVTRISGTQVSR